VKVAAYQAPLLAAGSMDALELIRARVRSCESEGVSILCCPEAILGGLADQSHDPDPTRLSAISVRLVYWFDIVNGAFGLDVVYDTRPWWLRTFM
jgi:hypothetical protein